MEKKVEVKKCGCGSYWPDYESIIKDGELKIIGYQANIISPEKGFFMFNHEKCKSTLGMSVSIFFPMHKGEIYAEKRTGGNKCKGYCLQRENFSDCTADCSLVHVRKIMLLLKNK